MNIEFNCPESRRLLAIDSKYEGTEVVCPNCKAKTQVPKEQPLAPIIIDNGSLSRRNRAGLNKTAKHRVSIFRVMARIVGGIVFVFLAICVIAVIFSSSSIEEKAPLMSVEEIQSNALTISFDNLMRNNKDYIGKIIYYRGKVIQVSEIYGDKYVLRIATKEGTYIGYVEDIIWVNYKGKRLLKDDIIDVWGKVEGLKTYRTVLRSEATIPELDSLHVELVTKAGEQ